jgi:hypothetical protein
VVLYAADLHCGRDMCGACRDEIDRILSENAALKARLEEIAEARRRRCCYTRLGKPKVGYETENHALLALALAELNHKPGTSRKRVYRCHLCTKWHLGKPAYDEVADENNSFREALQKVLNICSSARLGHSSLGYTLTRIEAVVRCSALKDERPASKDEPLGTLAPVPPSSPASADNP